jgi:ADP-ribose pyrophosphatase YjhB (NUDIX family)
MVARLHIVLLRVFRRLPVWARRRVVRLLAPSYTVGAIAVVERSDGAVLLVRHSYRMRWGTPGGLLARGETPREAVRREVAEEVGLDVEIVAEPAVVVDPEPQRVDVIFRCVVAGGADPDAARPRSPEIVECRWFPADELPELQHETGAALRALARTAVEPLGVRPRRRRAGAGDRVDRDGAAS